MEGGRVLPSQVRESPPRPRRPRGPSTLANLPSSGALERQLKKGLQEIPDLDLSSSHIRILSAYCGLVAKWSRSHNLVSARTLPDIVPRHILDSLSLSSFLPSGARRILDLGTGAGLPGLPLAVAHPECRFTLLDRSRKKTRFVRQAKLELDLPNVEVVAEEAGRYQAEPFKCVVARAVGSLAELVRCSMHLIATEGIYLLPKGSDVEPELQELPRGWNAEVKNLKSLAGQSSARTVVVLHPPHAGGRAL